MERFYINNYCDNLSLQNSKGEKWKDIVGYEKLYQVSNYGRVKGLTRNCKKVNGYRSVKERIIKSRVSYNGYVVANVSKNDISKNFLVHILVANHFKRNLLNKPTINHMDGIKTNNFYWNLEGNTYKENDSHARRTGLKVPVRGDACKYAKLKSIEISEILISTKSVKEISKKYNVTEGTIYAIKRGYTRNDITKIKFKRKLLDIETVLLILNSELKAKEASIHFNIKKDVYHDIKSGRSWSNITCINKNEL